MKRLTVGVATDSDDLRKWADWHTDNGHVAVGNVLYHAANGVNAVAEEVTRAQAARDDAQDQLAKVLTAITGETDRMLSVRNGWIVAEAGGCTCYGGGPYGHEPGCGLDPIVKLADLAPTAQPKTKEF